MGRARAKSKVKRRRKNGGFDGLRKRLDEASRAKFQVKVGLPSGSAPYPDGTPVIMVGALHEFGDPERGIPERS